LNFNSIIYSSHAVQRMFERSISVDEVEGIINDWYVIKSYPEDKPFPSVLILGKSKNKPIHVIAGTDNDQKVCHVITVYQPDPESWSEDFTERRSI